MCIAIFQLLKCDEIKFTFCSLTIRVTKLRRFEFSWAPLKMFSENLEDPIFITLVHKNLQLDAIVSQVNLVHVLPNIPIKIQFNVTILYMYLSSKVLFSFRLYDKVVVCISLMMLHTLPILSFLLYFLSNKLAYYVGVIK